MCRLVAPEVTVEKCVGCGSCIAVCPDRTLSLVDGRAVISGEKCMQCGHCVAVCPEGALWLVTTEESLHCATFHENLQWLPHGEADPVELVRLMRSRRSCRNYSVRPVKKEILEDLVKIGTTAPSGTNSQAWTFTILPDRSKVTALGDLVAEFYRDLNQKAGNPFLRFVSRIFFQDALGRYYRRYYHSVAHGLQEWDEEGRDLLFHGATAAILVGGSREASCPAEDALLATQSILLAAHALGLGTCLIGFVVEAVKRDQRVRRFLSLQRGESIYSAIAVGYPAEEYVRVAGRKRIVPRIL